MVRKTIGTGEELPTKIETNTTPSKEVVPQVVKKKMPKMMKKKKKKEAIKSHEDEFSKKEIAEFEEKEPLPLPKEGKKKKKGFWEGIGDSFSGENLGKALAYFTPDIIGGMLGYALGGERGALEGLRHANKVRIGVDEQKRKDAEFNLKRAQILGLTDKTKLQQTEGKYFIDERGEKHYVYFNPGSGHVFRTRDGQLASVPGHVKVVDPRDVRQEGRHGFYKKQDEAKYARTMDKVRKKETASYLELESETSNLISHFEANPEASSNLLGPLAGRTIQAIAATTGIPGRTEKDQKFAYELISRSRQLLKNYVRALSGTAYSDQELKMSERIIPSPNDPPATFIWKAKTLAKVYREKINVLNKHYGDTDKIEEELKKIYTKAEKTAPKGWKATKDVKLKQRIANWEELQELKAKKFSKKNKE
tara:strand:- start:7285 stop:8547 length:1263 start_codon:yes stop_codon:yes gene_type:complete